MPSDVTAEHHAALRELFCDYEVRPLSGAVAIAGFMNRYNDSLATVTDEESATWARDHLGPLGWDIGRRTGEVLEQRRGPPGTWPCGPDRAISASPNRP